MTSLRRSWQISSLLEKLVLRQNYIVNCNYECFKTFQTFVMKKNVSVHDDVISVIHEHLKMLKNSFEFYVREEIKKSYGKMGYEPFPVWHNDWKVDKSKRRKELLDWSEDTTLKLSLNSRKLTQFWVSAQNTYTQSFLLRLWKSFFHFRLRTSAKLDFLRWLNKQKTNIEINSIVKFLAPDNSSHWCECQCYF